MSLRRFAVVAVCLLALILGCGDDVTVRTPSAPYELFRRVQQFLALATFAIGEGRFLWGQGISNAYYAALTLARYKHATFYADSIEKFHQQVWSQSPKTARQYFRDELRRLRIKYDYDFDWPSDEAPVDDLRDFARDARPAFDSLVADTAKMVERRYRGCADLHSEPRTECPTCRGQGCEREVMIRELAAVENKLRDFFDVTVPKALSAAELDPSPVTPMDAPLGAATAENPDELANDDHR